MTNKPALLGFGLATFFLASNIGLAVYASGQNVEQDALIAEGNTTISEQSVRIATMKETAATNNKRLGVCLGSVNLNREHAAENEQLFQDVSDKWGVNYKVPIKDVFVAFNTLSEQLECV